MAFLIKKQTENTFAHSSLLQFAWLGLQAWIMAKKKITILKSPDTT